MEEVGEETSAEAMIGTEDIRDKEHQSCDDQQLEQQDEQEIGHPLQPVASEGDANHESSSELQLEVKEELYQHEDEPNVSVEADLLPHNGLEAMDEGTAASGGADEEENPGEANQEEQAVGDKKKEDEARPAPGNIEDAINFMVDEDDNMLDEEMIYDDGTTIRANQVGDCRTALLLLSLMYCIVLCLKCGWVACEINLQWVNY